MYIHIYTKTLGLHFVMCIVYFCAGVPSEKALRLIRHFQRMHTFINTHTLFVHCNLCEPFRQDASSDSLFPMDIYLHTHINSFSAL